MQERQELWSHRLREGLHSSQKASPESFMAQFTQDSWMRKPTLIFRGSK